jgi:hypothetical protein
MINIPQFKPSINWKINGEYEQNLLFYRHINTFNSHISSKATLRIAHVNNKKKYLGLQVCTKKKWIAFLAQGHSNN